MPENLYRKWRPKTFAEVAGQEHVTTTLVHALETGKVAHAYLFAGPRGTGKTSTGRLLAKALNCTNRGGGGEPCNECESCLSYLAGRSLDLIELDAASNRGIDEIRSLRDKVGFASGGDFKVYLIDEVHMLTDAAFNALLKTLEEPPPHVVFVLATTDSHKVPATIVSRCQRFDFRRVSVVAAAGCLRMVAEAEGFVVPDAGLDLIARSSTGSMRDAENILEQLTTSYGNELTIENVRDGLGLLDDPRAGELARLAIAGDLGKGLETIAAIRDDGKDLRQFQREVVDALRSMVLVKSGLEPADGVTAEQKAEMVAAVKAVSVPVLLGALRAFGEADLKPDPNSTIPLDIALADCILGREQAQATSPSSTPSPAPAPTRPRMQEEAPPREAPKAASPAPVRAPRTAAPPPIANGARETAPGARKPAPVADEVPRPATSKGAVAFNTDGVRALLPHIFDEAKRRRDAVVVGGLLNSECDIIEAGDGEVIFGFRYKIHADKAGEGPNLKVLAELFSEALEQPVRVKCVADANVVHWKKSAEPLDSPLVRAAQEMGARLLTRHEET